MQIRAGISSPSRALSIAVVIGSLFGLGYAMLNTLFDELDRSKPLVANLVSAHGFVDRIIPILAGALLGVAIHYWRARTRLAHTEAQRAEALTHRLQRIERDQAVWVVATATLHEVRNPLHALGLVLDEVALADDDPIVRNRLLERARVHMTRIRDTVAALRPLAETAGPSEEDVPLADLLRAIAEDVQPIAERDRIEVHYDVEPNLSVRGDAAHLRLVIENLLVNSLEAMRGRATVGHVAVKAHSQVDRASITVSDDGPGIDEAERARVFDPLATSKPAGLGLGLPIARTMARAMRGDVLLVERAGWATTFEVRMPAVLA